MNTSLTVLGVDLASSSWAAVGTALIECNLSAGTFISVKPSAITWPAIALNSTVLASVIDNFAREHQVRAVALDGPQGWRDPATDPNLPGVGRRCEYLCRTQGKTGVRPQTYPKTQHAWIQFSIEVFDQLLSRAGVVMPGGEPAEEGGYIVLECFPTSAWRSSGLPALPAKSKRPDLRQFRDLLRDRYRLPHFDVSSHDDLQAVVAALCAAAAAGGPAMAEPRGEKARSVGGVRVEGVIWNVAPKDHPDTGTLRGSAGSKGRAPSGTAANDKRLAFIYVTPKVLAQVSRAGEGQMQMAFKGLPQGSKRRRVRVRLQINAECYALVVGDTHAVWRSHQDAESIEDFKRLFAMAADQPGEKLTVTSVHVEP